MMKPRALWDGLVVTGMGALEILMISAAAGFIMGILQLSGLGFALTLALVNLGAGNVFLLLLIAGTLCIVMGMGMPTLGVYVLLAVLVAPSLVEVGITPLAAHMFILYLGMMSMITPPVAISGRIGGSAEVDAYRIALKAGQEIHFDVQANRTGSPLDATLILLDSKGTEVARSEDAHGLDPFLVFKAPADGEYTARLNDLRHLGGDKYTYHFVVGNRPYLESLFPFGGRRGSVVDVQLLGHRLAGADRLTLALAADAPVGRQELRARTAAFAASPRLPALPATAVCLQQGEAALLTPACAPAALPSHLGSPEATTCCLVW
jgi:hypothetical protein